MTVLIFVDTGWQIGDPDHVKVVRKMRTLRKTGSRKMTRKALFDYEVSE